MYNIHLFRLQTNIEVNRSFELSFKILTDFFVKTQNLLLYLIEISGD